MVNPFWKDIKWFALFTTWITSYLILLQWFLYQDVLYLCICCIQKNLPMLIHYCFFCFMDYVVKW